MRTELTSLLLAGLAFVGMSAPAFAQADDPLLTSMSKAGEVKVAIGSGPPWVYVSPSGEAVGYLVDVTNEALKGMGLPALTGVVTAWTSQIPALQASQVDMVAPGLQYTPERCEAVVYSGPVWVQQNGLYVKTGNPKNMTSVAELAQRTDVKLAAISGTSQETYVLQQGVKPEQIVHVADVQAGAATVMNGRADAFILGQFSIGDLEQKGLEVIVDKDGPTWGYGVTFRKENAAFRDAFDKQLDELRGNGKMKELYAGKYNVPNWELLSKLHRARDLVPNCD